MKQSKMAWKEHIPFESGPLMWGGFLQRTEPNGDPAAPIAVLGPSPAVIQERQWKDKQGAVRMVPAKVEVNSLQANTDVGREFDQNWLPPLKLSRKQIYAFDLMPYALADIPQPDELLALSRTMPGNDARLAEYLHCSPRRLLITIGNEAAAYVRGYTRSMDAQQHLYLPQVPDERLKILGGKVCVLHLAHPALLMKDAEWAEMHSLWCKETGAALIQEVLGKV